jgi:hypothetical protein
MRFKARLRKRHVNLNDFYGLGNQDRRRSKAYTLSKLRVVVLHSQSFTYLLVENKKSAEPPLRELGTEGGLKWFILLWN